MTAKTPDAVEIDRSCEHSIPPCLSANEYPVPRSCYCSLATFVNPVPQGPSRFRVNPISSSPCLLSPVTGTVNLETKTLLHSLNLGTKDAETRNVGIYRTFHNACADDEDYSQRSEEPAMLFSTTGTEWRGSLPSLSFQPLAW